jgi:hypothetical protein
MKTKTLIGLLLISAAIISLSGCAAKKAAWGSLEKGMIMKYKYLGDRDWEYQTTYDFKQEMEVMGQEIVVEADGDQLIYMKPLEGDGPNQDISVTVTEMRSEMTTPRGKNSAKLDDVINKPFKITISPLGKELDYTEAKELQYELIEGETRSLAVDVQAFFPDLPDHMVKEGDSWESQDIIEEESGSGRIKMEFNNVNTFEKLEEKNGFECMKINVSFTGTIEGIGKQENMDLRTKGELEGSGTWYYAYKQGILISQVMNGSAETQTEITGGPQDMTLPAKRTFAMTTRLTKDYATIVPLFPPDKN